VQIVEKKIVTPAPWSADDLVAHVSDGVSFHLPNGAIPIRYAVTQSDEHHLHCEIGVVEGAPFYVRERLSNIFEFRARRLETVDTFNAALIVPTGIGAEIGGHAGDASPIAMLLAESCDRIIVHPNVVNASDINEMPANALYVEGSVISRLLMGGIGLRPVRSNRVLVLVDEHIDSYFVDAAINTVSASRSTYGLHCSEVKRLSDPIRMFGNYSQSGRAVGRIENLEECLSYLNGCQKDFEAIALSSVIRVPQSYHMDYFLAGGEMVNPWGGVEAMLTHTISSFINMPSAHAPMLESKKVENLTVGIVDPRMAAEAISVSFLQCVLKGLHKSPAIVSDVSLFGRADVLSAEDISCIVIPDGCIGLPTIAALMQSIPVIAVRENENLMRNDLTHLPWGKGQFIQVDNYLEAAGVMNALRAGISLESLRRPMLATTVTRLEKKSVQLKN